MSEHTTGGAGEGEGVKDVSRGGTIKYKCRGCGEVYTRAHAPDVPHALQCAIFDFMETPRDWGMSISAVDVHHCGRRSWGVADLVGGQIDEALTASSPQE